MHVYIPVPPPRLRRLVALCASALALAGAAAADASAAAGPFTLAYTSVDRLEQSTGNLYWTSHYINEFGPSAATVYRASKSTAPGQEQALYTEYANGWFYFGDLTYAYTYDWHAYFVANYPSSNVSQIKRVPLAGGNAVTLATSPGFVGLRDIATDGSYLYWADTKGLQKMAITGGAVKTLVAGYNVSSVAVDATRVYYSDGQWLRNVNKTGGNPKVSAGGSTTVTSMHLHQGSTGSTIYWAEQNAAVRSVATSGGWITTHQAPIGGRRASSVSFDGTRVLWTDCVYPGGNGVLRAQAPGLDHVVAQHRRRHGQRARRRGCHVLGRPAAKKYIH